LGTGYLTPLDVLAIVAYLEDGSDFVAASDQITSYQYNLLNQLTQETDPDGNVTSYTYDADGNQISLTDPDLNTTTFSYDHLNRLVGESRSTYENATHADVQVSESLAYDAAGNLTRETDFDGRTLSSDRLICRYVSRKTLFPGVARALNGPFCKAGLNNLH
jgi:YD repeat-containing protein